MPSASEVYGGSKLEAAMLSMGREYTLTIREVRLREFDDGNKLELSFRETPRTMILNQTNARTVAGLHGDDYGTWPGKRIAIYRTKTDYAGRRVDCIRVTDRPEPLPTAMAPQSATVEEPTARQQPTTQHTATRSSSSDRGLERLNDDPGANMPF